MDRLAGRRVPGVGKRLAVDGIVALASILALGAMSGDDPGRSTGAAPPVPDRPARFVAIIANDPGDDCVLLAYDSSLTNGVAMDRFAHCPSAIFGVESSRSILVGTADHIVIYNIDGGSSAPTKLPLPAMNAAHYGEAKTGEAYIDTELMRDGARLKTLALGLAGDSVGAILGLPLQGDDTFAIGIEWNGREWAYSGSKYCRWWEYPCVVNNLAYRRNELKYPRPPHDVWTIDSASNPNLTSANTSVRVNESDSEMVRVELAFNVGGVESTVVATGEHYQDGPGIGTSSVQIIVGGKTVRPSGDATCGASIYSKFILTDGCGPDTGSIYSLESGEQVLAGLTFAAWFP
jgi:hypothetical protein